MADSIDSLPRLHLAHLPTPLLKLPALDRRLGVDLWIKRDDVTGGAESGNKLRKLELLVAQAQREGATHLFTCGGLQSNHARATALVAARLRMQAVLFLRVSDEAAAREASPSPMSGNVLLDRLAGAQIRTITPAQYRDRDALMATAAQLLALSGARPYVIPEGGSNGLGALGYVLAMREVRRQLDAGLGGGREFDVVVHACGSGGTAAGVALGIARHRVATHAIAMAVCDDRETFTSRIAGIIEEARALSADLPELVSYSVDDRARGPAYAVTTIEQRRFIAEVARLTGLIVDPVYTGKALHGLALAIGRGDVPLGSRVLFLHTGGLPGLLADAETFRDVL